MVANAGHERADGEPDRGEDRSRFAGAVLVLGAVTYGTNVLLFGRFVSRTAWGGPPGLVTILESPLWVPYRTAGMAGILLIAAGLVALLDRLYTRDRWGIVVAALGSLGLTVVLYLLEFVIAAYASLNLLGGEGSVGLAREEIGLLLTAYQGIGVGLLILGTFFSGVTLALVGVLLAVDRSPSRVLAASGVTVGLLLVVFGAVMFAGLLGPDFPEPYSQVLTGGWALALGVAELRRRPSGDRGTVSAGG